LRRVLVVAVVTGAMVVREAMVVPVVLLAVRGL